MGNLNIFGILTVSALKLRDVRTPLSPDMLLAAYQQGVAKKILQTKNQITDIGLDAFAALLGGGEGNPTVGGDALGPATFGTTRVVEMQLTNIVSPTAPAGTDTVLEGVSVKTFETTTPTLTVTYPGGGQVRFSGVVLIAEFVGTTFTEEGLFNENGRLIARTTFTRLHTGAFALQFDHTLSIQRTP